MEVSWIQADAVVQTEMNARLQLLTGGEAKVETTTVVEMIIEFPSVPRATFPAYSKYDDVCAQALRRAVVVMERNAYYQSLFRRDRARVRLWTFHFAVTFSGDRKV